MTSERAGLIAHARALQADPWLPIDKETGCDSTREFVGLLADEIERLRQGLWDIYRVLGGDTDGDETPRALVSDIVPLVMDAATEVRAALDLAWEENCGCL